MAHVFDGKLYFTRDHMQGNFISKNLKLPEPKPAPKPQLKASSSGEHVQLFRMVYDCKKGFQAEHLGLVSGKILAASGRNMRLHPPDSGRSLVHIRHPAAGQTSLSQKRK